jgi:hypothetical protein
VGEIIMTYWDNPNYFPGENIIEEFLKDPNIDKEIPVEGNCKTCGCPTLKMTTDPTTQQKYYICWECLMEE